MRLSLGRLLAVAISDPKDMPFLALAHDAGAWLVSGNLRHFPDELREGVTVLSPTDYLAHLLKAASR
jgi:predicted nucleic acid-binding protein